MIFYLAWKILKNQDRNGWVERTTQPFNLVNPLGFELKGLVIQVGLEPTTSRLKVPRCYLLSYWIKYSNDIIYERSLVNQLLIL